MKKSLGSFTLFILIIAAGAGSFAVRGTLAGEPIAIETFEANLMSASKQSKAACVRKRGPLEALSRLEAHSSWLIQAYKFDLPHFNTVESNRGSVDEADFDTLDYYLNAPSVQIPIEGRPQCASDHDSVERQTECFLGDADQVNRMISSWYYVQKTLVETDGCSHDEKKRCRAIPKLAIEYFTEPRGSMIPKAEVSKVPRDVVEHYLLHKSNELKINKDQHDAARTIILMKLLYYSCLGLTPPRSFEDSPMPR